MKGPPHSVIHINFEGGPLLFDARPIWAVLRQAEARGKLAPSRAAEVSVRPAIPRSIWEYATT